MPQFKTCCLNLSTNRLVGPTGSNIYQTWPLRNSDMGLPFLIFKDVSVQQIAPPKDLCKTSNQDFCFDRETQGETSVAIGSSSRYSPQAAIRLLKRSCNAITFLLNGNDLRSSNFAMKLQSMDAGSVVFKTIGNFEAQISDLLVPRRDGGGRASLKHPTIGI